MKADVIARSHCAIEIIETDDIRVILMILRLSQFPALVVKKALFLSGQDALEKFEFFPIKCRIQRAAHMYKMTIEDIERRLNLQGDCPRRLKTKVST